MNLCFIQFFEKLNQPFISRVTVVSSAHVAEDDLWNIVDKDVDIDDETLADPNKTFTPAVAPTVISHLNEKDEVVLSVLDFPTLYWIVCLCSAAGSIIILTIFHFPVKVGLPYTRTSSLVLYGDTHSNFIA